MKRFDELKFKDFSFGSQAEMFINEGRYLDDIKLLIIDVPNNRICHDYFKNFPNYLRENDVLVFNDVGISPSRLNGTMNNIEGIVDICFLMELNSENKIWEVVIEYIDGTINNNNFSLIGGIQGTVLDETVEFDGGYWIEKDIYKGFRGRVKINKSAGELRNILDNYGKYMHPWYKNINEEKDVNRNPIMSTKPGGILISEPGRRIGSSMLEMIKKKNIDFMYISLEMSFSWVPTKAEQYLKDYQMNYEVYEITSENVEKLKKYISEKKRIISIGTSGVRTLESLPTPPVAIKGKTNICIKPGFNFKYTDALLTNLHNSMGTHVIMASAIGGRDIVIKAYNEALERGYRFGIEGDAMLIFGDIIK